MCSSRRAVPTNTYPMTKAPVLIANAKKSIKYRLLSCKSELYIFIIAFVDFLFLHLCFTWALYFLNLYLVFNQALSIIRAYPVTYFTVSPLFSFPNTYVINKYRSLPKFFAIYTLPSISLFKGKSLRISTFWLKYIDIDKFAPIIRENIDDNSILSTY